MASYRFFFYHAEKVSKMTGNFFSVIDKNQVLLDSQSLHYLPSSDRRALGRIIVKSTREVLVHLLLHLLVCSLAHELIPELMEKGFLSMI